MSEQVKRSVNARVGGIWRMCSACCYRCHVLLALRPPCRCSGRPTPAQCARYDQNVRAAGHWHFLITYLLPCAFSGGRGFAQETAPISVVDFEPLWHAQPDAVPSSLFGDVPGLVCPATFILLLFGKSLSQRSNMRIGVPAQLFPQLDNRAGAFVSMESASLPADAIDAVVVSMNS